MDLNTLFIYGMLNDQLSSKLKLVEFGFNMNMILHTLPHVHEAPYPRKWKVRVHYGLSNQQMGIKYSNLQGEGSNTGPSAKPNSDAMLNNILS